MQNSNHKELDKRDDYPEMLYTSEDDYIPET